MYGVEHHGTSRPTGTGLIDCWWVLAALLYVAVMMVMAVFNLVVMFWALDRGRG